MNLSFPESAVRALLVSRDQPTIEQLSKSLQELAASTEVCTDIPNAIRLVNIRKFEAVVVDLKLDKRSEGVQATGGGNSVTSVPQQPDIIPLKEVEKHAILVAVKRLAVQGAALALGVGKTTIHRKLREWQYDRRESESGWRTVPITKLNT